MTLKSLTVATDFSDGARLALGRAEQVVHDHGLTQLTLIHVLDRSLMDAVFSPASQTEGRKALRSQADEILQVEAAALSDRLDIDVQMVLAEGALVDTLADAAESSDMLVMGARGAHRMRELALGSTAYRVVLRSPVPVLVVREPASRAYQRIVVATDFSEAALRAAGVGCRLATSKAKIDVLHAFSGPYDLNLIYANVNQQTIRDIQTRSRLAAEQSMVDFLADLGLPERQVESSIETGHASLVLADHVARVGADLLVVGKQGRSALGDLALGSVSQRALSDVGCDVLVVP